MKCEVNLVQEVQEFKRNQVPKNTKFFPARFIC